ncbi:MAG: hypothetical protein SGCHY_002776 [Lobulomycetales sp.]
MKGKTVSGDEIRRFAQASREWWNPRGQYSLLHRMNPPRLEFIAAHLPPSKHTQSPVKPALSSITEPFQSIPRRSVIDVGCGGGLVSECLARMGGNQVLGVDATRESIGIARAHAALDPLHLKGLLEYRHCSLEDLVISDAENEDQDLYESSKDDTASTTISSDDDSSEQSTLGKTHTLETPFDALVSLEVLEHVSDVPFFLENCARVLRPNGVAIFSTISQTPLSNLLTIRLAQDLLQWVPRDTHHYEKYIKPAKLEAMLAEHGFRVREVRGIGFNPVTGSWSLMPRALGDGGVNYILAAEKM